MDPESPTACVRASTAAIVAGAELVRIDLGAVESLAERLAEAQAPVPAPAPAPASAPSRWDASVHFFDGGPLSAQYLLVLDALNFCFWPDPGLAYRDLALGLRRAVEADPGVVAAERLARTTADDIDAWFGRAVWNTEGRAELVRQLGRSLAQRFEGRADVLVREAGGSADALVGRIVADIPGYDDSTVWAGRRICFYKRAQIFVADVWGAFGGRGLGAFDDIAALTTFADYRIPQILRHAGVLRYAPALAERIDALHELDAGGQEEIEIRSATVQAVERLRESLAAVGRPMPSVELDWWLWHIGEDEAAAGLLAPHHRVRTTAY